MQSGGANLTSPRAPYGFSVWERLGGKTVEVCVWKGWRGALYIPRQYIHFSFPPSAAHVTASHAAVERDFLFFYLFFFCFVVFIIVYVLLLGFKSFSRKRSRVRAPTIYSACGKKL